MKSAALPTARPQRTRSSRSHWGQRYQPFVARARTLLAENRFGPLSHIYFRLNRPTSARYVAWDAPWMLDPKDSGGGCLRNLGPHGLDLFLFLTGEEAQVTAAQISSRALGQPVEDYASVLLRSAGGVLGTIEVGNTFPRLGTDGESKIAWRDALLTLKDDVLRLTTADGEETTSGAPAEPIALTALRDALDHWRRGQPPPISVHDCLRAVRLIDRAYALRDPENTRGAPRANLLAAARREERRCVAGYFLAMPSRCSRMSRTSCAAARQSGPPGTA
jgi:predicted dehydrogenase